jgi:hypothetical protein
MIALTALEKEVIEAILSTVFPDKSAQTTVLNALTVTKRSFSSLDNRSCSGFFTDFEDNSLLSAVENAPHNFTVQAEHSGLPAGLSGFILFCDPSKKCIKFLEAFFYGDDMLPIEELLKEKHGFIVGKTVVTGEKAVTPSN